MTVGGVLPTRGQTTPVPVAAAPPVTAGILEQIVTNLVKPPASMPVPAIPPRPAPAPAAAVTPAKAVSVPSAAKPPPAVRTVPPEFVGALRKGPRTGPRNSYALFDALRSLEATGLGSQEAAIVGMGRFPVAGRANFTDDWLDPRYSPTFHLHKGTDIFAVRGTPVRAPADGSVRFTTDAVGGKSAYVTTGDGTYFYMTHLNDFSRNLRSGTRVRQGEIVGFVGSSGNAADSAPHVHFEIHPRGGGAVNPKPFLDAWVTEATDQMPDLVAARSGGDMAAAASGVPDSSASGLASVPAVASPFPLADSVRMATEAARALLLPLTPGPLGSVLSGPAGSP